MAAIVEPIENFFDSIGMMKGEYAPFMRFVLVGSVAGMAMVALKPGMFFKTDGSPRPWKYLNPTLGDESSMVPWWIVPVGAGLMASTFI